MEITAQSMSEIFDVDIEAVTQTPIGDGLVGLNMRVELVMPSAAPAHAAVPSSVVVKLPSLDETSRSAGVALRNYEREVKFYNELADTVDIRVPQCFHSHWDDGTGDFVLVLEDMAPAMQGNQVTGCDASTAALAVDALTALHGPRWEDPTLLEHDFLTRRSGADDAAQLVGLWQMFLPGFVQTYGHLLDDAMMMLLEEFGPKLGDWVEGASGPLAVTHGDYRLDNLLFGTDAGGPPVTAVDWQTPGHGQPIVDLAYFCGAGLLPAERRAVERDLLRRYVAGLERYGVTAELGWVEEQYRRHAFAGVIMAVVASQVVGGTDRSEAMFGAMATRHLTHCLDLDALDSI